MHKLLDGFSTTCCARYYCQTQYLVPGVILRRNRDRIKPIFRQGRARLTGITFYIETLSAKKMFEIVLFEPEIPPNTGNIMRLCANAPAMLHLIEPLGFTLDDRRLRRAGLDYHDQAKVIRHANLDACRQSLNNRRWLAFTTKAENRYSEWAYRDGDVLLFGPETRGLPDEVLASIAPEQRLVIPQIPGARSLNLSNAAAIVLYEAWRQHGYGA
jgi:tRNA (cytidine/uridine-2'-O-)-methyltransferase